MSLPRRQRVLARRIMRSVLCAAVALSQLVAIVGFPVLVSASSDKVHECGSGACGCSADLKQSQSCCCNPSKSGKSAKRSCCQQELSAESQPAQKKVIRWVAGIAAQKCKGDGPLALQSGEPLVSAAAISTAPLQDRSASPLRPVSDSLPLFDRDPPIPPPRLG